MEYNIFKLGDIATFSQGKQVNIENQYEIKSEGMVRFVRIIDYTNENEPIRYIKNFGNRYYVSENEVAMIRYGSQTAGMVVMGKNGIIANNLFKINLNNDIVLNKYMFYYLSQQKIFNYLRDSQSSSTMPAISFNIMNNLQINLPNIEYQSKIVKILDCLNNKIVINNKINNNLSYVT
jgi:type I restriction enzyme S subunit